MKRIIFIAYCLLISSAKAQVGVNTVDPTSSLTVNGSFGGKVTDVYERAYNIKEDDFYITYKNAGDGGSMVLPNLKEKKIEGRVYHIKNSMGTGTVTLHTGGNGKIVFGDSQSAYEAVSHPLPSGNAITLVAGKFDTWEVYNERIAYPLPNQARSIIKYTEYDRPGSSISQKELTYENLKIRLVDMGNNDISMQFALLKNNSYTILWYAKEGTIVPYNENFAKKHHTPQTNQWYFLDDSSQSTKKDRASLTGFFKMVCYISLEDLNEIYKITTYPHMNKSTELIIERI